MRDHSTERNRRRRMQLRAEGVCINGRSHGPAVRGGRCQECIESRRIGSLGLLAAYSDEPRSCP